MNDMTNNLSILLVEDSPTQSTYFQGLLEWEGHRVRVARNGAEALMRLGDEMSQIIVSDCDMPLLDGFQLCRLLKDHPSTRHIPFLLLTGSPSRLSRFWARTCGADSFLLKEGPHDRFLETVRSMGEAALARQAAEDSGIWDLGLRQTRPLKVEDLTMQLARALEHRLLEVTVRNSVAALEQYVDEPEDAAWRFLQLFQDLVSPGALYLLWPNHHGHICHVLASPGITPACLSEFLSPLRSLPYIADGSMEQEVRIMDWEPVKPRTSTVRHYPLAVPACEAFGQWGLLTERSIYESHRILFKEATLELGMLFQVMMAHRTLKVANARLKRADEAKTSFLLTLSHDLRSPLTSLRASLDLMHAMDQDLPPKAHAWIDVGLRSVDRLVRMVNGVLDLEKIESGSFEYEPVPVEVHGLSQEAIRTLEPLATSRQVQLLLVSEEAEGCWIHLDPDRLMQILVNLISNAIKFSPSPGQIRIGIRRLDREVSLYVQDEGPGIPTAFQPRIFGKFQQAERKASGSGLGLAICKHLAEGMGGRIRFESEEGKGARFEVLFPEDAPPTA